MTNTEKLKKLVEESGLKKQFISKKLGISYNSYLRKEQGKNEFKLSEVQILKSIFGLNPNDVNDIFFDSK